MVNRLASVEAEYVLIKRLNFRKYVKTMQTLLIGINGFIESIAYVRLLEMQEQLLRFMKVVTRKVYEERRR